MKKQTQHENTYEEWRLLLLDEGILSKHGKIDLEVLEKRYPDRLDQKQIIWIERMQKGEVYEDGEDVVVEEVEKVKKVEKVEREEDIAEESEAPKEEPEEETDLEAPPLPGESKKASKPAKQKAYEEGDTFKIQIEEDAEPEEVTIVKIAKDGIHLSSSNDEETEYLVDPDELTEMIVS